MTFGSDQGARGLVPRTIGEGAERRRVPKKGADAIAPLPDD